MEAIDPRIHTPLDQVLYPNLFNLRVFQNSQGEELKNLTDRQWGLAQIDRCHHITTSSQPDSPTDLLYNVKICKTCSNEDYIIDLGTFPDQESAILVNDTFEILHARFSKLLVLRKEDKSYLYHIRANIFDDSQVTKIVDMLRILSDKLNDLQKTCLLAPQSPVIPSSSASSPSAVAGTSLPNGRDRSLSSSSMDLSATVSSISIHGNSKSDETLLSMVSSGVIRELEPVKNSRKKSFSRELENLESAVLSPRKRAMTFSAPPFHSSYDYEPADYDYSYTYEANIDTPMKGLKTPMAALTWLASMEDEEVDVAKSLFALKGATGLVDDLNSPKVPKTLKGSQGWNGTKWQGERQPRKNDGNTGNGILVGEGREEGDGAEEDDESSSTIIFEDYYRSKYKAKGFSGRARSNSMPELDSSTSAFSILSHSSGFKTKDDPLSITLRKFYEKGGVKGDGYVGIYSPEDRKHRIQRFLEKRKHRMWAKKVKYDVRKNFADSRIRVKGRFVKKEEENIAATLVGAQRAKPVPSTSSTIPMAASLLGPEILKEEGAEEILVASSTMMRAHSLSCSEDGVTDSPSDASPSNGDASPFLEKGQLNHKAILPNLI